MRIAIDAMGGDFAPREIVAGTVLALKEGHAVDELILVGDEAAILRELDLCGGNPDKVSIRHASEVVGMDESPAHAVRRKKDSSISVAINMLKAGEADAVFSAGNTGAVVAASTLKLRTLAGVVRPAIATVIPTAEHPAILLDAGANTDCNARMLTQFAIMGNVYAREILGITEPRVGMVSIGEEDAKGNEMTKEAFRILERSQLNFIGNVESKALFGGDVDVAVCDGFVGNIILKTGESVAKTIGGWMRDSFSASIIRKLAALMLRGAFKELKQIVDPEAHGGAPLLGANGLVFIGHGSSSATAVSNGIRVASESVAHDINHLIEDGIRNLPESA